MTYSITKRGPGQIIAHVPLAGGGLGVYRFHRADALRAFLTALDAEPEADADRLRELHRTATADRRGS